MTDNERLLHLLNAGVAFVVFKNKDKFYIGAVDSNPIIDAIKTDQWFNSMIKFQDNTTINVLDIVNHSFCASAEISFSNLYDEREPE